MQGRIVTVFCDGCSVRQILQQLLDAHDKQDQPNPPPIFPKLASLARKLGSSLASIGGGLWFYFMILYVINAMLAIILIAFKAHLLSHSGELKITEKRRCSLDLCSFYVSHDFVSALFYISCYIYMLHYTQHICEFSQVTQPDGMGF